MSQDLTNRELALRTSLTAACLLIEHMIAEAEAAAAGHDGGAVIPMIGHRKCVETFRASLGEPMLAVRQMALVVLAASSLLNSETDLATLGSTLTDLTKADPLWIEHALDLVKATNA
jgi:hypothetical protein